MFRLSGILAAPTATDTVHQSVFRDWQVLQSVRNLLEADTPPKVVLAFITEADRLPQKSMTVEEILRYGREMGLKDE